MKRYPVHAPRDPYRGNDDAKKRRQRDFNAAAKEVEDYLNAKMAQKPDDSVSDFLTINIARELNLDSDLVHRIVFPIDGGHNGVTIYKGDYDRIMAKARGETPA